VVAEASAGDLVLTMGAGDITRVGEQLMNALSAARGRKG
jgi:UDP-N-acetylmuramate-alanine ligase